MVREIRELGYRGSSNLLVCHINQGQVEGDRAHLSPCRTTRLLLTVSAGLTVGQHETLAGITGAWTEMTVLAGRVSSFADLLTPDPGRAGLLTPWITAARSAACPTSTPSPPRWMGCRGIAVARSTDGGRTWGAPVSLPGTVGSNLNTWDPAAASTTRWWTPRSITGRASPSRRR